MNTVSAFPTVRLTNSGTASLSISSVALTGPNAAEFYTHNNCGIEAPFRLKTRGAKSASIQISDDAGGSPQTIALTGVATVIGVSPASLTFPSQTMGTTSQP